LLTVRAWSGWPTIGFKNHNCSQLVWNRGAISTNESSPCCQHTALSGYACTSRDTTATSNINNKPSTTHQNGRAWQRASFFEIDFDLFGPGPRSGKIDLDNLVPGRLFLVLCPFVLTKRGKIDLRLPQRSGCDNMARGILSFSAPKAWWKQERTKAHLQRSTTTEKHVCEHTSTAPPTVAGQALVGMQASMQTSPFQPPW